MKLPRIVEYGIAAMIGSLLGRGIGSFDSMSSANYGTAIGAIFAIAFIAFADWWL